MALKSGMEGATKLHKRRRGRKIVLTRLPEEPRPVGERPTSCNTLFSSVLRFFAAPHSGTWDNRSVCATRDHGAQPLWLALGFAPELFVPIPVLATRPFGP